MTSRAKNGSIGTMNIREKTGIIIERGGEFLVAYVEVTQELRWSSSPWDAWITRKRDKAQLVADRVNGRRFLFNPVAGQLREMGERT